MADASTIASVGTAAGTLVLGVATFASVRSANRSARVAERALMVGLRPVLVPSRPGDPVNRVMFAGGQWVQAEGGGAAVEHVDGRYFFVIPLRNVGQGLAVMHGWQVLERLSTDAERPDPEAFRRQNLDMYVAPGDIGQWQGAVREPQDPLYGRARQAHDAGEGMTIDLLYGDHEGGQRTISRFVLIPDGDGPAWRCNVIRHWVLEGLDPRSHG